MPKYEIMKSLEREGFHLDYPETYSNEDKIIELLKEDEKRLLLAIPLILEKGIDYKKIKKKLESLKKGKELLNELDKIILITEEILKKMKRNAEILSKIIQENKIKSHFEKSEMEYYLGEFKESKREVEMKNFQSEHFEKRLGINSFNSMEKIFSPVKIKILRKIYEFKGLTPTEKMYYYRDIKPLIDAVLNKNLQGYLEIIRENKKRRGAGKNSK